MRKNKKPHNINQPVDVSQLAERERISDVQWGSQIDQIIVSKSINGRGSLFLVGVSDVEDELTPNYDVRGSVGYGGGEFHTRGQNLVFCTSEGQIFFRDINEGRNVLISDLKGGVASPRISPNGKWIMYVFSDGETDLIAINNSTGLGWPRQLVRGADFYMQPDWHPNGEFFAWTEWDHPSMPWDASVVKIGEVGGMQLQLFSETWIAGGVDQAAHQPIFSPDGKWLSYIQRNGEWDDLVLYSLKDKQTTTLIRGDAFHLCTPAWIQGIRTYGWDAESQNIFYLKYHDAKSTLWIANIKSGQSTQIKTDPYTWFSQISISPIKNSICLLASSPKHLKRVVKWERENFRDISKTQESIPEDSIPFPQHISIKSSDNAEIFGLLYLPSRIMDENANLPLIVDIHGGPTGQRNYSYAIEPAFFTTRGYAVVQVNYRGSFGYGYRYQDALKYKWCIYDVEDAISICDYFVKGGIADKNRLFIIGSSSGGTTVLNALIHFPHYFKAAICCYGVSDLIADAEQTHKFESNYHRFLIGDLIKDRKRFEDRSPINHIDQIVDPVALFHGGRDKVVSPSQTEQIAENLHRRGIPYIFQLYPNEGHGFREPATIQDYFHQSITFLERFNH